MESPSRALTLLNPSSPTILSRRRRLSSSTNSPEFEFWRIPSSSFPHSPLHSADELFSDGFLLPLHLLRLHLPQPPSDPDLEREPEPEPADDSDQSFSASITSSTGNPILTASKRWKDIFKRSEKSENSVAKSENTVTKSEKRREKKNAPNKSENTVTNSNSTELNINIWPFYRSRSAGNNSGRPRPAGPSGRKVSSAPCSRSNSSGESKSSSRRSSWPNSPGRTGVHLGRSSPVWQIRRNRAALPDDSRRGKPAGKGRVLNLNVPMCIGYRQQLSCRSDDNGDGAASRSGGGSSNGNIFGLRGLFSKKNVLTV